MGSTAARFSTRDVLNTTGRERQEVSEDDCEYLRMTARLRLDCQDVGEELICLGMYVSRGYDIGATSTRPKGVAVL